MAGVPDFRMDYSTGMLFLFLPPPPPQQQQQGASKNCSPVTTYLVPLSLQGGGNKISPVAVFDPPENNQPTFTFTSDTACTSASTSGTSIPGCSSQRGLATLGLATLDIWVSPPLSRNNLDLANVGR